MWVPDENMNVRSYMENSANVVLPYKEQDYGSFLLKNSKIVSPF